MYFWELCLIEIHHVQINLDEWESMGELKDGMAVLEPGKGRVCKLQLL